MLIRGTIAVLGLKHAEWQAGQSALAEGLAAWRSSPDVAPVLAALEQFGEGSALEHCGPLASLFYTPCTTAKDFAESFVTTCLAGLAAHPLAQLPLLQGRRDAAPTLVLARSGRASLALAAFEGSVLEGLPAPKTVRFAPQETWLHVLSGSGMADHILCRQGRGDRISLQSGRVALEPGTTLYRYGPREALQVREVAGSLALLRLQRQVTEPEPLREYSMPDGTLVQQAAARVRDTRRELAMALLGRMGRVDAVAPMKRIARGGDGPPMSDNTRWQALSEVLALDTQAGLDLLELLASRVDDPLAQPAAMLQASLAETWPELERTVPWPR